MKRTKLLRCIPCTVPKVKNSDSVIAASQLLEVDGERAVEISPVSYTHLTLPTIPWV